MQQTPLFVTVHLITLHGWRRLFLEEPSRRNIGPHLAWPLRNSQQYFWSPLQSLDQPATSLAALLTAGSTIFWSPCALSSS